MKSTEERLRSYEPLWENWKYTGEFLGEGGMSSVFEIASDAFGSREFSALKIITVMDIKDGKVNIPKTALNEINILRSLSDCPNIVHYSDSTVREIRDDYGKVIGADVLIRMEKLKVLTEGSRLSEKEIINLANDMCRALSSAQKKGIIHRDIKPQNIFVDTDGTFKLGDFGVAKIVSEASMHYTKDIGTLAYAAPELCSDGGALSYDVSTDLYSLGLVLYTFLNDGHLPFTDSGLSTREAVLKRIRGSAFPSPKNGSKNLKKIVMRACEFDPRRRYRTADEILEDLEMLAEGGKKKYILDPYATVDANEDGELIAYIEHVSSGKDSSKIVTPDLSSGTKPRAGAAGLSTPRIIGKLSTADDLSVKKKPVAADTKPSVPPSKEPTPSSAPRLMGTMKTPSPDLSTPSAAKKSAPLITPGAAVAETPKDESSAPRLRSTMKTTAPGTKIVPPSSSDRSITPVKEAEAKEKTTGSSRYFKTPEL